MFLEISRSVFQRDGCFSIWKHVWNDYHNCTGEGLLKSEMMVRMNLTYSCQEVYQFVGNPEENRVLKAAKSDVKYKVNK